MNILTSVNATKKEIVKSTTTVLTAKDFVDQTLTINSIVIYDNYDDSDTDDYIVTALGTTEGQFISSISPTVKAAVQTIINLYNEEEIKEGLDVVFKTGTSNGGREFIYLELV